MLQVIVVDAAMSAAAVLGQLAHYGLWIDAHDASVRERVDAFARVRRANPTPEDFEAAEKAVMKLRRSPDQFAVAIRRQWYASVLWYSRPADEVLRRCRTASPADTLLVALGLHEPDSRLPVPVDLAATATRDSIILDAHGPIGVAGGETTVALPPPSRTRSVTRAAPLPEGPPASSTQLQAWPRVDAPPYAPALKPFDVTVGLSSEAHLGTIGGAMTLAVPAGIDTIPLTVILAADGVDAPNGWTRPLDIVVADPTSTSVTFTLIGREPSGTEPVQLTMLEARYVRDGVIVGSASRPLVIGKSANAVLDLPAGQGIAWLDQPPVSSPMDMSDGAPIDLTIEITKPDRNASSGAFTCMLHSRHPLSVGPGPYPIDLGSEAKTFAKEIVDQVRMYAGDPLVENLLESVGGVVAEALPGEAFVAITDVARLAARNRPSVLIVSAEPYVPWELAWMKQPLSKDAPPHLGAQVALGRWMQDAGTTPGNGPSRPSLRPLDRMTVRHMAVMAGKYGGKSGLRDLPAAEQEAKELVTTYDAVPLAATSAALRELLLAELHKGFDAIGGIEAAHFAGHGEFNPAVPDSSVLYLSDGRPLSSMLFRSAKYGGERQPLLFLNACMIGIGGQVLGDMGGFPGHCLRGGFGGLLGALWEVDDDVACSVAIEFWKRVLPASGDEGEPVGAVLQELRSRFSANGTLQPSYLAYVYYGHPQLTLRRQRA